MPVTPALWANGQRQVGPWINLAYPVNFKFSTDLILKTKGAMTEEEPNVDLLFLHLYVHIYLYTHAHIHANTINSTK